MCRRRVAPLMMQFPPSGGEAVSQAGVAPKVQTTSVKNAENGLLWVRWSAFWAQLCRIWCVVRAATYERAHQSLDAQVNPLEMHVADAAHARMSGLMCG